MEKDGTFVNCHGRVQRIGQALPPLGNSREDWRFLIELGELLNRPFDVGRPEQVFQKLAETVAEFEGLSYETIGTHGDCVAQTNAAAGSDAS